MKRVGQNQSYSQELRDQRQKNVKEYRLVARENIANALQKKTAGVHKAPDAPVLTHKVTTAAPQQNQPSSFAASAKHVAESLVTPKTAPQATAKTAPALHEQSARQAPKTDESRQLKQDAKDLNALITKMPARADGPRTATPQAVAQKAPTFMPDIPRAGQTQTKQKTDDGRQMTDKKFVIPAPDSIIRGQAPAGIQSFGVHTEEKPQTTDRGTKTKDSKERTDKTGKSGAAQARGNVGRTDSGPLMQTGAEGGGAEGFLDTAPEPLPELDPSFISFNEHERPAAEMMKSKALVYSKHVEKRITEIAKFNEELEFQLVGLKDRVEGDLAGLITSSKFLEKVYG